MVKPRVIHSKCIECYSCLSVCPVDAIKVDKRTNRPYIDYRLCIDCGSCIDECPVKAIKRSKHNAQNHRRNNGRVRR